MTDPLYTLCAGTTEDGTLCPFFIEENYDAYDDDGERTEWAEYVHLHRGDSADEALDDHDAIPGEVHTLDWWKANGPSRVTERFVD